MEPRCSILVVFLPKFYVLHLLHTHMVYALLLLDQKHVHIAKTTNSSYLIPVLELKFVVRPI